MMSYRRIILLLLMVLLGLALTSCEELEKTFRETFSSGRSREEVAQQREQYRAKLKMGEDAEEESNEDALAIALEFVEGMDGTYSPELQQAIVADVTKSLRDLNEPSPSLFYRPDELKEAQEKLYKFMGTDQLYIYSTYIYFEKHRIRLELVHPERGDEVDNYFYLTKTGEWEKGEPSKLTTSNLERIAERTTSIKKVDFSVAHTVFMHVLARMSGIEGAEIPSSILYRHLHKEWRVSISSPRADYDLRADKNGNITSFERR